MQQWEYKKIRLGFPLTTEELNAQGRSGWELAGILAPTWEYITYHFKRRVEHGETTHIPRHNPSKATL